MRTILPKPLRFAVSAVAATVVVVVLMTAVLWGFGLLDRPDEDAIEAHPVEILSSSSRVDVAELVGAKGPRELPELPPLAEIPALEIPPRESGGFVQVEFEVDEAGRVQNAEVVNAMPAGVYEDQALEAVRSRRWAPDPRGGKLTEVVRFSLPAASEEPGQAAGTSGLRE
ncbi:MAG: TonB family protein [Gammaproteobacteria bacterium]